MPAPTLDDLKLHLRIRHGREDVDLQLKLDAAIEQASQFLNRPIPWLADVQPEVGEPVYAAVPASVRAAILIGAAELYANREAAIVGATYTAVATWQNLLYPYRVDLGV